MGAIFPNETAIYIAPAGTAGSALVASQLVTTEIESYNVSGGSKEIESKPLFGNAFLDVEKPREQYEISFDVVVTYENAIRWESILMNGSATIAESKNEPASKRIFITSTDGATSPKYKTMAMDNCRAVSFEPESTSDEYQKGTITFKFSPTDGDGLSNYKITSTIHTSADFN
jgi:hypothetical protein